MEHVVVRLRCVGGHCGKKEKEETNGEEKKSVFIYIYMRIILPYGKSCTYRVSYIFVRSTVDSISRNNVGDVSSFN